MVAVIVPVFNVEPYLRRCVDSILSQTYREFILILVDDGSSDGSGKICDMYASKDDRVSVLHQENGGLSAARNAGIKKARSNGRARFVTFVDSDDWVDENYLSMMHRLVVDENIDIVACRHKICYDEADALVSSNTMEYKICSSSEFWGSEASHRTISCAKMYAIDLFEGIDFPVGKLNEDEFTTYRLIFRAKRIADVDNCLYYYYQRPGSIMNSGWTLRRLEALDGKRAAVSFFESNCLREAWRISADDLLKNLATQIGNAKRAGELVVSRDLTKEYRSCWRKWKKELHICRFGENGWYYYPAYNWIEKIVWLLLRSIRIIKEYGIKRLIEKIVANYP